MKKTLRLVSCSLVLALSAGSQALWAAEPPPVFNQVLAAKNRIGFVFSQMGVPIEGHFRKADIDLVFDAAAPARSTVRLNLDLGSVDAGSADANQEVVGRTWFDVKRFPTATFVSSSLKSLGANRYEMSGKLTIKGRSHDVAAPVTVTQRGDTALFDGGFTLKRLAFGIGDGAWSDTSIVADDVKVSFHVEAARSAAK